MSEVKNKEIESVTISYDEFTAYDHLPIGNFYFKNAMGEIIYLKTSSRELAQMWIDQNFPPKGKYKATPSKIFKVKSRQENGEVSVRGVSTRRGQQRG